MSQIAEYLLREGWLDVCRMDLLLIAVIVFLISSRGGNQ